jgi:fibro-slime domain-containing protein
MHKAWFILFPVLTTLSFAAAAAPVPPLDSLGGKTVHVYLPSPTIDNLLIENMNVPMKQDAQYWYSYTFTKAGLYDYQDGFYFSEPQHRYFFSKAGLGGTDAPRFLVDDFGGMKEIWIIVDPAGPANAKPIIMTSAPKIVNILNPWPATGPKLLSGTKTQGMITVSGHCGWFSAMLVDTTMTNGHFAEVGDAGTFGKGGFGGAEDFDFAALFAQYGPTIWLNTEVGTWSGSFPNLEGTCQYMMAMTVRDFSKNHPDFDFGSITGNHVVKGVVEPTIGPEPGRKPVPNPANANLDPAISFSRFDEWWVTDSTRPDPYKNYESCYEIPMSKSSDGGWEYDSYRDSPDHGFWPLEGTGLNRFNETNSTCYVKPPPDTTTWVTAGPQRNGNFCAEAHAAFTYEPGQRFAFRGDDDVWVFIDGKLVIDLGGVHVPESDSVDLDKLGLTANKEYKWDFFYCDRQPCGSSLRIKTSIYFKQSLSLFGIQKTGPTPVSVSLEVWKRIGGNGSCASAAAMPDSVKAANLTYQLLDASGELVKELASGNTYYGGITIAEPVITVDTSKLGADNGLTPGAAYRVVALEPSNPTLKVGVSFRNRSSTTGMKGAPDPAGKSRRGIRYRNVLGRRVQGARFNLSRASLTAR